VAESTALASVTSPDTGAKISLTAFTDSTVPKTCPAVIFVPAAGISTNTTSPSSCCA
jgi:hypothetical protein